MIREYPHVRAAEELADVALHVAATEFVFRDPAYDNAFVWQSDTDLNPALRVVIEPNYAALHLTGRIIVRKVAMVIVDSLTEYRLGIPILDAPRIPDDPYVIEFVDAFRQYDRGRTPLGVR